MNVYLKAVRTANADPSKLIVFLRPFNERDDFFDQMCNLPAGPDVV